MKPRNPIHWRDVAMRKLVVVPALALFALSISVQAQPTCKTCVMVQPPSGPNPAVYECQVVGEFEIGFHECEVLPAGLGCALSGLCNPTFHAGASVGADGFHMITSLDFMGSQERAGAAGVREENCRGEVTFRRLSAAEAVVARRVLARVEL
jgi:hypothetical protein